MARQRGLLITFEGGEGSGKSTQVRLLAEWLAGRGLAVVSAREPGTTPVGEAIRHVVLDPGSSPMSPVTELLLYEAARAEIVVRVVEPALAAGKIVLLDRYEDSTFAYQGGGRGIPLGDVQAVNEVATGGLRPDLTVLIDLPAAEGRRRREADAGRGAPDRLEREAADFHRRVRDAYHARAAADPRRFLVVDGQGSPTTIQNEVRERVLALLEPAAARGAS